MKRLLISNEDFNSALNWDRDKKVSLEENEVEHKESSPEEQQEERQWEDFKERRREEGRDAYIRDKRAVREVVDFPDAITDPKVLGDVKDDEPEKLTAKDLTNDPREAKRVVEEHEEELEKNNDESLEEDSSPDASPEEGNPPPQEQQVPDAPEGQPEQKEAKDAPDAEKEQKGKEGESKDAVDEMFDDSGHDEDDLFDDESKGGEEPKSSNEEYREYYTVENVVSYLIRSNSPSVEDYQAITTKLRSIKAKHIDSLKHLSIEQFDSRTFDRQELLSNAYAIKTYLKSKLK